MSSDLGKNAGHTPGSLGGRSIVVIRQAGRQADDILADYKNLKIFQVNF